MYQPPHFRQMLRRVRVVPLLRPAAGPQSVFVQLQAFFGNPFQLVITDPTTLMTAATRPVLPAGSYLTVRIFTGVNGQTAFLYSLDRRVNMVANGPGIYEGAMYIDPSTASLPHRFFAVNVLSHDTLFDDALPYDSATWIIPYDIGLAR